MFCTYDWLPNLNINEVTTVQNFDPFLNMVTSLTKQLTIFSTGMLIEQWHIYTWRLMILPQIVLELSRKMCQFHLNMNTEGWLCRLSVTSSVTSSACELFFMHNLHMVFPFLMSNWTYIEQVNFLKGGIIPCIFQLLIDILSKKFTELRNFNIWPTFFTWWPSFVTYFFATATCRNQWLNTHVYQVWWWYVKAFVSYAWQNGQTNRQTDGQTDRQTNGQTNILAKIFLASNK